MASAAPAQQGGAAAADQQLLLHKILAEVQLLRAENEALHHRIDRLDSAGVRSPGPYDFSAARRELPVAVPVDRPASPTQLPPPEYSARTRTISTGSVPDDAPSRAAAATPTPASVAATSSSTAMPTDASAALAAERRKSQAAAAAASPYPARVVLTTYPGQVGIKPLPLNWGAADAKVRGPVVASRHPGSIRVRNAIGAHGGSYCIYHALSIAIGALPATHRPNLDNTEPPVKFPQQPAWSDPTKICSMDPFGHMVQELYTKEMPDVDIRPSIAITKAHMKIPEIDDAVRAGRLKVDGKILINEQSPEIKVTKAAVEPVWYLPGVAARFGVDESLLRRAIFEDTGGMYPELITRPDLKVWLPPIGSLTVYIFGDPKHVPDTSKELTLRVHDECNGSDVFGSDICTCRPYLCYGIEEGIKSAQRGGSGVVVYFRKEGRALGEVTKYLVYNSRKRGGDLAAEYFKKTENVAGVKDARFQALMPDVLHWLGITKIDKLMSMSNMKYDAIVGSGIVVKERHEIPPEMIPEDSRVEIDAKIAAGYFSSTGPKDLNTVKGRTWDDIAH